MYRLEIICPNCKEKQIFERPERWRIIELAHEMEGMIIEGDLYCKPCQSVLPMRIVVRNMDMSLVVFEKIITPSDYLGGAKSYGTSPIEEIKKVQSSFNAPPSHEIIKNPCMPCCGTGKLHVQYKAHKELGSFKGVIIEGCPMCDGKGYLK